MSLPVMFGTIWDEFIENWCAGNVPAGDRQKVENALSDLLRIWPEREADLHAANVRGFDTDCASYRDWTHSVHMREAGWVWKCIAAVEDWGEGRIFSDPTLNPPRE